jgi:glycosyltransferase involved in cell wall biosynthesis
MNSKVKKKKLIIIYDAIYPFVKGGTEKRNYELSKRLAQDNFDVHIYGAKWWEGNDTLIREDVTLHGICKPMPLYTKSGRRSIWQALYFGVSIFKLIREDFDVIEVNQMPYFSVFSAKAVCLIKRKKLFATWNEVWGRKYWIEYMGIAGNLASIIEKVSIILPDEIIAVSEHTAGKLKNELNVKNIIHIIPNGIDLETIKKVKPSSKKSDIIFAGRLLLHKNVDMLIRSVFLLKNDFPNITCYIVGEGPERKNLEKLTQTLKLEKNITFFNFFEEQNKLYALMKSSKIFVFPSTREGFGLVVLEANACGIPVITVNHNENASKNLIDNENGIITRVNKEELANAIKLILKKKYIFSNLFKFSDKYKWDEIANQLKVLYK